MPGVCLVVHYVGAVAKPCGDRTVTVSQQQNTVCVCLQQESHRSTAFADAALTCDGILAAVALLGHISLVAVHTVNVVLVGSEASSCQRFTAGVADETFGVPGLVLIADSSRGDGLRGAEKHDEVIHVKQFEYLQIL